MSYGYFMNLQSYKKISEHWNNITEKYYMFQREAGAETTQILNTGNPEPFLTPLKVNFTCLKTSILLGPGM